MEDWKRSFVQKLNQAQSRWVMRFEDVLNHAIVRTFEELTAFVRNHGFRVSTPLQEEGRRSFKFELAENAYLLMIFRSAAVGEFELRCECFCPGCEPVFTKALARIADVDETWAQQQFRSALDTFVELLAGNNRGNNHNHAPAENGAPSLEELVTV